MTAAAAGPLLPNDPPWLGAYELVGRLGEGGQSVVYLGRDRSGRQAAVKVLRAQLSDSPEWRARFGRELAVIERVAGFCTAQVLDADVAGDLPYVVSEYVAGPSLTELVRSEGPRTGTDLDRLAIGTITAVTAIHRAGILHRDLKPSNVLMGPDGPRVIDFGISRVLEAGGATKSSGVIGTPSYMAPEQVREGELGTAVDIFAWAATMLFAATGRQPFGHDTISAVFNRILHQTPDLSSLPAQLREVAGACLAKDPADRPDAQQVLLGLLGGRAPAEPDSALATGSTLAGGGGTRPLPQATRSTWDAPPPPLPQPAPPPPAQQHHPVAPPGFSTAVPGPGPGPGQTAPPAAALQETRERRVRRRRRGRIAAVAAPLLALAVGAAFWLLLPDRSQRPAAASDVLLPPGQAQSAVAAAPAALRDLFDYDHRTVEQDIATARGRMTPRYQAQFDATLNDLRAQLRDNKGSVVTTVVDAAAISAAPGRVGVLAFVKRTVRGNAATRTERDAVRVSLVRQGGTWLVDTQNILRAGTAAAAPAAGTSWPGVKARAALAAAAGHPSIAGDAVLDSALRPAGAPAQDPAEAIVLVTVAEKRNGAPTGKVSTHRVRMRLSAGRWTPVSEQRLN